MKKNIRFICIISLFVAAAGFLKAQPWMQAPYMNSDKSNANFYDVKNAFNEWSQDKNLKKTKNVIKMLLKFNLNILKQCILFLDKN